MNRKSANSAFMRLRILPALALAGTLVLCLPDGHAVQKYQYSQQLCNDCHGMPPVDAAYRNVTTGGFQGSHQTHATSSQPSCEKCHNGSNSFTTDHSDGFIHMSSNINASPHTSRAVYGSKGVFFNQTSNPVLGTCSNVNCHFETPTPVWSSSQFTSPDNCNRCHGTPPAGNAGNGYAGGTAGSHSKHNDYYNGASQCVKCHTDHTASASTFAHATSLRSIVVVPRDPGNAPAGSYNGTGANFLPSRQAAQSFGTCSGTYCHSNGQSTSGPYSHSGMQWGGAATTCTSCHGGAAEITTLSGKHQKHVGTSVYAFTCNYCHYDTTADGSTIRGTAGYAVHVNKSRDVAFDPVIRTSASSWSGSQCENIYCHGSGQTLEPTDTVDWYIWDSSAPCSNCHGYKSNPKKVSSGSHTKHVADENSCTICHNDTVDTGMGTLKGYTLHVNRSVDLKLSAGFSAGSPRYGNIDIANRYSKAVGSGFASCSGLYCHSDGKRNAAYRAYSSKKWGATSIGCNGCHGNGNGVGSPDYTNATDRENSHQPHRAKGATCDMCHNDTTTTGTTITGTKHLDGSIDLKNGGTFLGTPVSFTFAAPTNCTNISCHANGNATWGSTLVCNSCHPTPSGVHAAHIGDLLSANIVTFYNYTANKSTAAAYRLGCANCHPMDAATYHINGTVDLTLNKTNSGAGGTVGFLRSRNSATTDGRSADGSSGIKDSGGVLTCLAAYCHSNGMATPTMYESPDWRTAFDSAAKDRCAMCHGNSPNSKRPWVWSSVTTMIGSAAHYNTYPYNEGRLAGGHVIGIHYDRIYNGFDGMTTAGASVNNSHGNATVSTTINCNICHYTTVTGSRNDNNVVCNTCHKSGNTANASFGTPAAIADKSNHVNGRIDVAFKPINVLSKAQVSDDSIHFAPYSAVWTRNVGYKVSGAYDSAIVPLDSATMWDGATGTCSNIACHNGQTVKWSDTNGVTQCESCHTAL